MAEEIKGPTVKATGGGRLRISLEVWAGVVPGLPMEEYTKRWLIDSDTYYAEMEMPAEEFNKAFPDGIGKIRQFHEEAIEYMKQLMNPNAVNWVRLEWIYL